MAEKRNLNKNSHVCFRDKRNRITPIIVTATASIIIQIALGPAPSTIGIGPINTIALKFVEVPERAVAVMIRVIPMKIRRKPRRNSLSGVDHGTVSTAGASGLRSL